MGITLKAARVNKNLTQREAAKRIGVSEETLSLWERFKAFPNIKHIPKIESVYDVSYNDIIFLPSNHA